MAEPPGWEKYGWRQLATDAALLGYMVLWVAGLALVSWVAHGVSRLF